MLLSDFIKEVRGSLGLSQTQLAHALDVNFTTINRWENHHFIPSALAQKVFFAFCEKNCIPVPDELQVNGNSE